MTDGARVAARPMVLGVVVVERIVSRSSAALVFQTIVTRSRRKFELDKTIGEKADGDKREIVDDEEEEVTMSIEAVLIKTADSASGTTIIFLILVFVIDESSIDKSEFRDTSTYVGFGRPATDRIEGTGISDAQMKQSAFIFVASEVDKEKPM